MTQPIYLLFLVKQRDAWYQLSQEEKDSLYDKISESLKKVGADTILLCDSSWSTEQWPTFGVIKFPDLEALQKHRADTNKLDWPRYVEAMSVLGTEQPS